MDRVLIISEFTQASGAPTGALAAALAKALKGDGLYVSFLNVPFKYRPGGLRPARIFNMLLLHLATPIILAILKVTTRAKRVRSCVVVTSSPPLMQWGVVLWGKLLGIPVVYWLQDAHPEIEARILERSGWKLVARMLRTVDRICSRHFSAVLTLDEAMKKSFLEGTGYEGLVVVQPPAATYLKPAQAMRRPHLQETVKFLYAGNYGATHDLTPFAKWLSDSSALKNNYTITFVGMNSSGQDAIRHIFAEHLPQLIFLKRFDSLNDLMALMSQATFGVVALSNSAAGVVCPSKAISYLSQGLPLLHVGPKDVLSWTLCQEGWGKALAEADLGLFSGDWKNTGQIFPNPEESASAAFVGLIRTVLYDMQSTYSCHDRQGK